MKNDIETGRTAGIRAFDRMRADDYDFNREMQLIDARYRAENALLDAVAAGDDDGTIAAYMEYGRLMQEESQEARPTSADPVRDFKNSVLVTNTLFRKAIERHVHPIYIHESSSYFGAMIEHAESAAELTEIIREMVSVYCRLAREYSKDAYPPVIMKTILYIEMNLASSFSTRDLAARLYLNPNYLSTLFTHEVGVSISEYILDKRIALACRLLRGTSLPVQEVAAKCGLGDASYFSRQFRRVTGVSPSQYRKE